MCKPEEKVPQERQNYPGFRSVRTTSLFRVVNFELFVKPNKYVMFAGAAAISFCAGYLLYLNTYEGSGEVYTAINEDGSQYLRKRKSKWD